MHHKHYIRQCILNNKKLYALRIISDSYLLYRKTIVKKMFTIIIKIKGAIIKIYNKIYKSIYFI